ncbi:DUF6529 family protein [Mangrovihabitans endophyticus]|uniref:Uncharacterized protein n=1 Tax=Mangrovihabitans endophyticus TaxID=1751298 RepID=A0A8J3FLP5_9ACTN|nr:DUF6529 family protein [Mangrovihabitans endophyticus]GGK77500.1 hypothetical protein GCM10012284_09390 [Mangrovihabitans endophyticus]
MQAAGQADHPSSRSPGTRTLLVPVAVGGAAAITIGVYGSLHTPTGVGVSLAGFSSPVTVKVWLASASGMLALVQLASALVMYGRVPGLTAPRWTAGLHRWSGRAAFLLAVPVAVHCLYALGASYQDPRTLLHSLAGCLFFGAFTTKMLILRAPAAPGWALPLAGGLVFVTLAGLWLTASLWFFITVGPQI